MTPAIGCVTPSSNWFSLIARTGGNGLPISETRLVRPALLASTFSIGGGT